LTIILIFRLLTVVTLKKIAEIFAAFPQLRKFFGSTVFSEVSFLDFGLDGFG